jgi:hypothetical protein
MTRENATSFHKIFLFLSQIITIYNLVVKTYGSSGAKDQGYINAQFSFKLCGDMGFHGYFSTLLTFGRSDIDYGKHVKG